MMNQKLNNHIWQAEEYHRHSSVQFNAAAELFKYLRLEGNERIIDIGCGDGKITATIANSVKTGSVLGIDISPEMIKFAQKTFPSDQYSNLYFLLQDAHNMEYKEEFDIAFSSFAIQWFTNKNAFFKKIHLSLKQSGYLALTIPLGISSGLEESICKTISKPKWLPYFCKHPKIWNFTNESEYKQLLVTHQFEAIRFEAINQLHVFPSREKFEKYVLQWFPYSRFLPRILQHEFFKQVIDKYFEIELVCNKGEVHFQFPRLDIIATKIVF
ncbi:MAG: class I SAM-dependent methyltransferase [Chlamydiales bacterium]